MVPTEGASARIGRQPIGREDVLPLPLAAGIRALALHGVGKIHAAVPAGKIGLVDGADPLEVNPQRLAQAFRQHRDPVLEPFAVVNQDLVQIEVDILDSQPQDFHHAQPASIEKVGHEGILPG